MLMKGSAQTRMWVFVKCEELQPLDELQSRVEHHGNAVFSKLQHFFITLGLFRFILSDALQKLFHRSAYSISIMGWK